MGIQDTFSFSDADKMAFAKAIPPRAKLYAPVVLRVAHELSVSPFLITAMMDRESRCGEALVPPGAGGTGDMGHGHGLMQIDDRSWGEWLRIAKWQDPYVNITKGVSILRDNLFFFSRPGPHAEIVTAANSYANRCGVPVGTHMDPRPLYGAPQWQAAIAAYNTGASNVLRALAAGMSVDITTAGHNYSGDVLQRATLWEARAAMR